MLSSLLKKNEYFFPLAADGPIRGLVALSTGTGEVRGYVGSPMLGEMKLTEAVGLGTVQVVKNHPSWPNPYNGITAIRSGDIDLDIGKSLIKNYNSTLESKSLLGAVSRSNRMFVIDYYFYGTNHRCLFGGIRTTIMCPCSGDISQWYSLHSSRRLFD